MPPASPDKAPAPNAPRLHALVPCAGSGERSGASGPKQYARLGDRCVVGHTLAALHRVARLDLVWVVLSPHDREFERHVPGFAGRVLRSGGTTRAETVANSLAAMSEAGVDANDWVLVHDGARCLVRPEWIDALIDACRNDADGGLLALPVADTLKQERDGRVGATVDRRAMWQAQTPQMFRLGRLREAMARAGAGITDEASAIEAIGDRPRLVAGSLENFKLTYPADFDLAERMLRTRPNPSASAGPVEPRKDS